MQGIFLKLLVILMIFFKLEYKEIHKYSDMILKMIAVSLIKLKNHRGSEVIEEINLVLETT